MTERGIFTGPTEDSFKGEKQIKRELAFEGDMPIFHTPLPEKKGWKYWSSRFRERQQQYKESSFEVENNHVEISFPHDTLLNFIGDIHAGHPEVDYERIEREVEMIVNTPNSFVVGMGDWIDAMCWNPGQMEQMEQTPEQVAYMKELLGYLSDNGKLILALGGDHDLWQKREGRDPYRDFAEEHGAYYMRGVGYMTANIGEAQYKITAAHRHSGFSIYNFTQSSIRLRVDEALGSDIAVTGHTHRKGYLQQPVKEFGGEGRNIHYLVVGPYKITDEYSKKKGFSNQVSEQMYGSALLLSKDNKETVYFNSILKANNLIA